MTSTVDDHEIEHFSALASRWWDYKGPHRILHEINPLRLKFIIDKINQHFSLLDHHRYLQRLDAANDDMCEQAQRNMDSLSILDVGCGGGLISLPLAKLGGRVCGIDASRANIDAAQDYAKKYALANLQYRADLVEDHAVEHAGFYDVIIAFEVIEHVSDKAQFLSYLRQMLKPGGLLLMSTISRSPKAYLLNILLAEQILRLIPRGTHEYVKLISPGELHRLLRGMQIVDLQGLKFSVWQRKWLLSADSLENYMIAFADQPQVSKLETTRRNHY